MDDLAAANDIPYVDFRRINDDAVIAQVRSWEPDLFFVVGLSQIVTKELLRVPSVGCVGFHPTRLPEGRGRAPVAWLVLDACPGAATFFLMDEGADSGPILVQEPFSVSERDYASDVIVKLERAIDRALDRWLPRLRTGEWSPVPQGTSLISYNGRRTPSDGLIDWNKSSEEIFALIRAASRPHPGAYTYVENAKMIIWRAQPEYELPMRGVPGRILCVDRSTGCLVQTGNGLLWLTEIEFVDLRDSEPMLRVGAKLGYSTQDEIHLLTRRLEYLEKLMQKGSES
jgi:methionyl-tRNA formyltransferase